MNIKRSKQVAQILYGLMLMLVTSALGASSHVSPYCLASLSRALPLEFSHSIENKHFGILEEPEPMNQEHVYYKSLQPYKIDDSGKWFMKFRLSIYNYDSVETANLAMAAFEKISNTEFGLSKCYDYVIQTDDKVYWLNAPCSIWDFEVLVNNLHNYILNENIETKGAIRCRSGGFCGTQKS